MKKHGISGIGKNNAIGKFNAFCLSAVCDGNAAPVGSEPAEPLPFPGGSIFYRNFIRFLVMSTRSTLREPNVKPVRALQTPHKPLARDHSSITDQTRIATDWVGDYLGKNLEWSISLAIHLAIHLAI